MDILLSVVEIIFVDLILGGDNAIVIALATKNLDKKMRKKASLIGACLAIVLRIIFVLAIILLGEMHIPFLNIIMGGLLIHIALQLVGNNEEEHDVQAHNSLAKAVRTIVLADAVMSLDNAIVIAMVASKAPVGLSGEILLIAFGLLISLPIILFGASILTSIIDKYKFVVYLFGLMLVHVGLEMMLKDELLHNLHNYLEQGLTTYFLWILALVIILIKIVLTNKNKSKI